MDMSPTVPPLMDPLVKAHNSEEPSTAFYFAIFQTSMVWAANTVRIALLKAKTKSMDMSHGDTVWGPSLDS